MPTIIDLNAEAAKLTMFRGLTPQTTRAERKGSSAELPPYRDGLLLLGKSAGTGHWETHPEDELVHVLDGARTLEIVCDDGPPRCFELRAGMLAVVPRGAWHRVPSASGSTSFSATLPGDHINLDVVDPRTVEPGKVTAGGMPSIVDVNAEAAKLTMFRGRTPQTTFAARKGSAVQLAPYRDGFLLLSKFAGKSHWETHPVDELVWVLEGTVSLDIIEDNRPQSCTLGAGMTVIVPQGAWHRFHSADGVTAMSATVPGEHVDLDIDDPRKAERRQGVVVQPGEGLVAHYTPGRSIVMKLLGGATGDSIMLFEETVPPGTKSTFHLHHDSDEVAYVLSGEVTFLIGDDVTVGGPGTCAFMPRGVRHAWKSTGAQTGRVVFLYTPARAGGLIEEQQRTGSKLSSMTETERTEMLRRYGWELLGPSPL